MGLNKKSYVTVGTITTVRPVVTEHHVRPAARHEPSLFSRILLKIAVLLWLVPAFFLGGWLLGARVAASERHDLLMACLWCFGIGCVLTVIAGLRDAAE